LKLAATSVKIIKLATDPHRGTQIKTKGGADDTEGGDQMSEVGRQKTERKRARGWMNG